MLRSRLFIRFLPESLSSLKRVCVVFHQVSNEVTQDEHNEKLTQPPLEREVFAEVVWQWGT